MSTNPERAAHERASDALVHELSRWLAGHASVADLREAVEGTPLGELAPGKREAVEELREELRSPRSGAQVEVAVRETLEALALGD